MNAFSAGSNANIQTANMEINNLKKQQSNTDIYTTSTKNNGYVDSIVSDAVPERKLTKIQSGIGAPLLLNNPSVEFESIPQMAEKEDRNTRNLLQAGTYDGQNDKNYDWDSNNMKGDYSVEEDLDSKPIMVGVSSNLFPSETAEVSVEGSKRPQTSHGRGRQNKGNVRKREEKTSGLGETSKDLWAIDDEQDISKKQIMADTVQA